MLLYGVTVKIMLAHHEDWVNWMRSVHIPDVMATKLFKECRLSRLIGDDESEGITYSIQYLCHSRADFMTYQEKHAPALQADHTARYKDKFVAFRTMLDVVEIFN